MDRKTRIIIFSFTLIPVVLLVTLIVFYWVIGLTNNILLILTIISGILTISGYIKKSALLKSILIIVSTFSFVGILIFLVFADITEAPINRDSAFISTLLSIIILLGVYIKETFDYIFTSEEDTDVEEIKGKYEKLKKEYADKINEMSSLEEDKNLIVSLYENLKKSGKPNNYNEVKTEFKNLLNEYIENLETMSKFILSPDAHNYPTARMKIVNLSIDIIKITRELNGNIISNQFEIVIKENEEKLNSDSINDRKNAIKELQNVKYLLLKLL